MIYLLALGLLPLALGQTQTCFNYGTPQGSSCLCPPGYNPTGTNGSCALPVCGGSLYDPAGAAPGTFGDVKAGGCVCRDGWTGPGCSGETGF
jgi:hypothetical protein